ncbi:MAG: hypothetical protein A2V85_18285 [Chloroflexi bacterium RBG_16_72_14]|nr:MAG: hypothetical protein A2V85_18285 [Chloroflexi bacterium RBG_16_72_14]
MPTPSAWASPSPGEPPAWMPVGDPGPFPGDPGVEALVATPSGFLAVLNGDVGMGRPDVRVLTSVNGSAWTPGGLLPGRAGARLQDLALGAAGFVAVGSRPRQAGTLARLVDTCESEPSGDGGATWWSPNGAEWTLRGRGSAFDFGPVLAVTAFGDGFVAVGGKNTGAGVGVSAAWVSPDGRRWTRARGNALRAGAMYDLATIGRTVVAVGRTECLSHVPMAWTSSDGRAWTATQLGPLGTLDVVASGPGGLLAAGWSGDDLAPGAAWRSSDGVGWEPATLPPDVEGVRDIVGLDDRYLLVDDNGLVWSGSGGGDWVLVLRPEAGSVDRVVIGHGIALAIGTGWAAPEEPRPAAVWTLPLDSLP